MLNTNSNKETVKSRFFSGKKLPIIIAMLLTAAFAYSQAPNTWTKKANFGGGTRGYAVGFTIGNNGYISTGDNFAAHNDCWEYDPAANTWTQKANFGGGSTSSGVGFSIGNKGYLIGGGLNDFWEFDPIANTWTQKTNFPGIARIWATGLSIGDKGYVGSGTVGPPWLGLADFWEYDPTTDTWTQKADVGGTARYAAVGFSIGSKGYIGTGSTAEGIKNDFWEYDPVSNAWTQKADFGGTARSWATGLSIGSKGYIGTGTTTGDFRKDFYEYYPNSDAWTKKTDFGGTGRYYATAFSINGKGYLGTGYTSSSFVSDFWEYTPDCFLGTIVYKDADGDGYGNPSVSITNPTCDLASGYVLDSTDCDDANATVHPNAIEIIGDGIDNNCNGQIDEDLNNALNFDGVNDYVNVNNTLGNFGTGDFTVEAYLKTSSTSNQYFVSKRLLCGGSSFWNLVLIGGKLTAELDQDNTANHYLVLTGSKIINDGKWHHVAVTRTSGFVQLYVDGNPDGSAVGDAKLNNTNPLQIGAATTCDKYFQGLLDEFRIWNVARTQSQVQTDMIGTTCGNETGLLAYCNFDQGIAGGTNTGVTTANDITGNNNNGTLTNFALTGSASNWVTGVPGLSDSATFYQDADGDGYGNAGISVLAQVCNPPSGYVSNSTDCNDANAAIHPGAKEICGNGIDDNCNGQIDEECLVVTPYTAVVKEGDSGNTIMPFVVSLNAPAIKDCGVKYRTIAGTATEGVDYIKDSGSLRFTPGELSKIIYIKIKGDKIVEPNERFTIRLYHPVNLTIATKSVPGIIVNDDSSTAFATTSPASNTVVVNGVKVQGKASLQIMPNPNKGSFTLQMQLPDKSATTTLTLYNNFGQKVWQQNAGQLSGSVSRNIALESKLVAGVYSLQVQHGGIRLMQKVVVIK